MPQFDLTDVFYITLPVNHRDEAVSLAEYLNQHGVCAHIDGVDAVIAALTNPDDAAVVVNLKTSWLRYWEHSDSGLFGLPMYTKPPCPNE